MPSTMRRNPSIGAHGKVKGMMMVNMTGRCWTNVEISDVEVTVDEKVRTERRHLSATQDVLNVIGVTIEPTTKKRITMRAANLSLAWMRSAI
eukprot:3000539-Amphidinium_carterae.1